jgi:hypothetical protein
MIKRKKDNYMNSKIISSMEDAKKYDNAIIYDIDDGIELVKNFIKKTIPLAKEFKKVGKKQNGKDPFEQEKIVINFVKKFLFESFNKEFVDKFFINNELSYLEPKVLYIYIFGLFVIGHSKNLDANQTQEQVIARTLTELSSRAFNEKKKKEDSFSLKRLG